MFFCVQFYWQTASVKSLFHVFVNFSLIIRLFVLIRKYQCSLNIFRENGRPFFFINILYKPDIFIEPEAINFLNEGGWTYDFLLPAGVSPFWRVINGI